MTCFCIEGWDGINMPYWKRKYLNPRVLEVQVDSPAAMALGKRIYGLLARMDSIEGKAPEKTGAVQKLRQFQTPHSLFNNSSSSVDGASRKGTLAANPSQRMTIIRPGFLPVANLCSCRPGALLCPPNKGTQSARRTAARRASWN